MIEEQNEPEILSNQTTFFEQELLEQNPPTLPVEEDPNKVEKELVKKKRKRMFVLGGTIVVFLLLVGTAGVILFMPVDQTFTLTQPSPIPFGQTATQNQLTKRLEEVEADLRTADPILVNAPFPPVNLTTLYLDQPPR